MELMKKFNLTESGETLIAWRNEILDRAAHVLASPMQNEVQRLTDMWDRACDIGFPSRDDMLILPNGCLVFDVNVAGHIVHFAVWMTFGEVRIGAKVPIALVPNSTVSDKLSRAFNGQPCWREVSTGSNIVYDWTFTDGFASYEHMKLSLRDDLMAGIIAWRSGEILTHLYISILSFLVEGNGYTVTMQKIAAPLDLIRKRFVVRGDINSFVEQIMVRGGKSSSKPNLLSDGDGNSCEIHMDIPVDIPAIPTGDYRDQDGGEFTIVSIETA
jgi:hypothetical protein